MDSNLQDKKSSACENSGTKNRDDALKTLFQTAKSIAIIGAKDTESQPVDRVGRYLIDAGYTVYPVHSKRKKVWGLPAYTSLTDIPYPVDIVNVFRAAPFCLEHAKEVLACKSQPKAFWLQLGICNEEALALLRPYDILTEENSCIMVEHKRLMNNAENNVA